MEKLVILGGGESGVGAAVLGKTKGMEVFLSDAGTLKPQYREMLENEGIDYEEGGHTEEKILSADLVIKSPGIPPTAPLVEKLAAKGTPILSEIEFAGRYTDAKMICITGSNGKTTTTLLTYRILKEAGLNVGLAGNVGKSMALQVAREKHDVYVIELSSFQLENMYDFKAKIAVITNITPDHLDRYDHKMENYVAAKFRILQNQGPEDYFIYWQDDPIVREQIKHMQIEACRMPFSEFRQEDTKAYVDNGIVRFETPMEVWDIPRDKLSLTGLHNLYNSMAAGLSAGILNIKKDTIRHALEDFEAVEHRLEYVRTVRGVRYINDSKATNVNSTWYALESMTTPTVLILGGKDKGNDYTEIENLVKEKVKAIVCMGKDNSKLLDFFGGKVPCIRDTHSLEEAVDACAELASDGDTVLLSPCCASFDLFKSYEDRGLRFKKAVMEIKDCD
ncbi:MAG: UDP-N-acetylmuramoyl-L-alanine--D-glutamate ligase [Bacteroidales bacterium]|nr:UDP-N-acetylmuramoyl-L-alanine--D-glutamate ligase [Bacteroidales bacterium]MBD5224204.1 UDP-N-acetylmuramoyl-L-alanine--D-glutamate ligase [Bacteroidales bacterium]MBD5301958.1 UDP-N-acetylmuramoyl-L-alanine--D-glutamate ligase [Bacteroides sp.]